MFINRVNVSPVKGSNWQAGVALLKISVQNVVLMRGHDVGIEQNDVMRLAVSA